MEQPKTGRLGRWVRRLWRAVDLGTRILFSAVVLMLTFLFLGLLADDTPTVPSKAALVISPSGQLVEQLAGDPVERAVDKLFGEEQPETLWRDVDDAIRAAKDDDRIQALLLDLDKMADGYGLSKLQALKATIEDFKASGKKVIARADFYGKSQYYLAAAADEIHLHHMGMVLLDGYGRYATFFKEGIDRLELDWHVFRVGEYKSAVEPFLRNDMSEEAKEANLEWMGDLWSSYVADVAAARGITPEALTESLERFNEHLREAGGQASDVALKVGLVDHVGARDTVRDRMVELVGEDPTTHSFHQIALEPYLKAIGDKRRRHPAKGEAVAVVIAKGEILNGTQAPGTIGGDSTAQLIRDARNDEDVRAIVLRVDSPGGSAFASEVIRRELVLARQAGKKVVVSMGTVAASGGYWISSASDEIWASPNTITGSIGIFGMFPTFQKPMAKYLGWRVDGVGTAPLAGAMRPDRELQPGVGELIQTVIERGYREFLERVSEARGMTPEDVDKIARGRVWSGQDAHELGLVDQLGGLEEAIASAASLAGLEEGYAVRFMEKELDFEDKLMLDLLTRADVLLSRDDGTRRLAPRRPSLEGTLVDLVRRQAETLALFDDPNGVYAYCFCEPE